MAPQHDIPARRRDRGGARGRFAVIDRNVCLNRLFGPIVTLSLSREMFATFEDLDHLFPIDTLRDGHIENTLKLLAPPQK